MGYESSNAPRYILMATFNGDKFISEQLKSILDQADGWTILIGDDGSTDGTLEIIKRFQVKHANIHLYERQAKGLGPRANFARLLAAAKEANASYIALADQDDIWMPHKLRKQLELLRSMEDELGDGAPILTHSNLAVMDEAGMEIHHSFMKYQGIRHEDDAPLKVLLCQNFVTGNTVMMNRAMLDISLPIPDEALMHDWWLALCAATLGIIGYIDEPLVKYRQHHTNTIGAQNIIKRGLNPLKWKEFWTKGADNLSKSFLQAEALRKHIHNRRVNDINVKLIKDYAKLLGQRRLNRIKVILSSGIHMQSSIRHCLMMLRLVFAV